LSSRAARTNFISFGNLPSFPNLDAGKSSDGISSFFIEASNHNHLITHRLPVMNAAEDIRMVLLPTSQLRRIL
jgi:hypothetical protein